MHNVEIMSRAHLGLKRPIRRFDESFQELLDLLDYFESNPKTECEEQRENRIKILKERFNNCIIQLNNIKNTEIQYIKESGE